MNQRIYPLSALVGQDSMRAGLVLNAIDPTIGGLLIRGQKGTGKSTAARALARLLPQIEINAGCPFNSGPHEPLVSLPKDLKIAQDIKPGKITLIDTPFIELPLNATEDRLCGTLQMEKTMQTGQRYFEPGLLAAANRGILYVDEVNLLDDHLVDLLLDASASGINKVEREGFSLSHPSRFLLIGTMNPEEGELRPQFLDRFGLCIHVESMEDASTRAEIIRRRISFERDPISFDEQWLLEDKLIANQIIEARKKLHSILLTDALLNLAAELMHHLKVQGHRADIALIKTACAHAAFLDKTTVEKEDILTAAQMAIPHRLSDASLGAPESLLERIQKAFLHITNDIQSVEDSGRVIDDFSFDIEEMATGMQIPGACAAGSVMFTYLKKKSYSLSTNRIPGSV